MTADPSTSGTPKPSLRPGTFIYEVDPQTGETQQFTCGRLLGEGGFAKCVEVSDGANSYALKAVNRATLQKPKNLEKLHSEIAIHRRMKHKHIVNFIRSFKDKHYVYMLLEKCDCGTVKDLIKARPLTVEEAQYVMLQCLSATQYMHKNNVIHRDLKPGNIMLDSSLNVKIGDFGLATEMQFDGERKRTICGTPNYMAPEIVQRNSDGHSFEVDTWSLGVILYTMLVGDPPFQMEDVESTYRRIRQGLYEFPSHVSENAQDLIRCMLSTSPSNRPTLIDIRTHQFFATPPPPMMTPVSLLAIARRYRHRSSSRRVLPPATTTPAQPQHQQEHPTSKGAASPVALPIAVRDENVGSAHRDVVAKAADSMTPQNSSPRILRSIGITSQKVTESPKRLVGVPQPLSTNGKASGGEERLPHQLPRQSGQVAGEGPSPQILATGSLSGRRRHTLETGNSYRTSSPHLHPNGSSGRASSAAVGAPTAGPSGGERRTEEAQVAGAAQPRRSLSTVVQPAADAKRLPQHPNAAAVEAAAVVDRAGAVPRGPSTTSLVQPTIWVRRCVDFTRKYGFCYLLSNKVVGAMFNDVTKLFWDLRSDQAVYIVRVHQPDSRQPQEDGAPDGAAPKRYSTDSPTWFAMDEYPESLKKKVTLIKYFKTFLTESTYQRREEIVQCSAFNGSTPQAVQSGSGSSKKGEQLPPRAPRSGSPPPGDENWVYVKGWARVEDTHIFRFSNKSVQVCFADGSEMFFFWQLELVTYRHPGNGVDPPVQRTLPISEVRDESKLSVGLRHIRSAYRYHDMF